MLYGLFALASLTATPNVVVNSNSQYEVFYNYTLTQDFLTNGGEFSLDFVDNSSNALMFSIGRYNVEFSPNQSEFYFTTKVECNSEIISYKETYIDNFSNVSWLNIRPTWYLPFESINDLVGKSYKLTFKIYSNADFDTFGKANKTPTACQYLYNTDNYETAYASGLDAGQADVQNKVNQAYEEGKAVGISEGISKNNNLLDVIVAIPDRFISTFQTIFNFEILGVNVGGLMITIISLGVVIFIIKKVV